MTTMREALDEYRNGLWEDAHEYAAMGAPDEVVTQLTGIAQALDELLKLPDAPGIPWRVCSDVPATEADGDMWGQVLVRTQIGHMLMVSWRGGSHGSPRPLVPVQRHTRPRCCWAAGCGAVRHVPDAVG